MARVDRKWAFSLIWINLGVTMVVLILITVTHVSGWKQLLQIWAYSLAYANGTGIPAILLLPRLIGKLPPGNIQISVVIAATIVFAALGCLAVQTMLMWLGVAVPKHFWQEYFHTLRLSLILAGVFCLGAFFYGSMRERLQQAEARLLEKEIVEERTQKLATEARLRSLESRIHPHFLFNTLNSISALIAVNPVRAEQIVGRLAALLRSSLDSTNSPLIPLHQELAILDDYVDIEKVRFGGKLEGQVVVPDELRDCRVPPLSIQSLVENAVKHGITPQRNGGKFFVTASEENGSLRIEVSDTGMGFDLQAVGAGHGLDNLVGRLDALFGSRAQLKVFRREGRCVVEMMLPRS